MFLEVELSLHTDVMIWRWINETVLMSDLMKSDATGTVWTYIDIPFFEMYSKFIDVWGNIQAITLSGEGSLLK